MSGAVMYQSSHPYFTCQRTFQTGYAKKCETSRSEEPSESSSGGGGMHSLESSIRETAGGGQYGVETGVYQQHHHHSELPRLHRGADCVTKREKLDQGGGGGGGARGGKDFDALGKCEDPAGNAQYLSSNCVVFTYYTGDISKVVDEHFSKALSDSPSKSKVPLAQRNLPASFWDSEWTPPPSLLSHPTFSPAGDLYGDHYSSSLTAGLTGSQADPWQNYMAAQVAQAGSAYSHRGMDVYSARSYSSLLLQSNLGRSGGRAGIHKPGEAWPPPAGIDANYGASHSHYGAMTGLDGSVQAASKDLYWF